MNDQTSTENSIGAISHCIFYFNVPRKIAAAISGDISKITKVSIAVARSAMVFYLWIKVIASTFKVGPITFTHSVDMQAML